MKINQGALGAAAKTVEGAGLQVHGERRILVFMEQAFGLGPSVGIQFIHILQCAAVISRLIDTFNDVVSRLEALFCRRLFSGQLHFRASCNPWL